ncbi:hypothetical protein [Clostridium sp. D33t1_170424_F3]|uniref:hypothetical protein n=1 Tax=Clostridium sp. D33t1_170424_F3 TaxID=2787099 RepID=UPI0018AC72B7|nr:hypothetical protein [Clostridium sp. D33t1_170424_F3]
MLSCENHWCIYNEEHDCMLEEIELDRMGLCRNCILNIPDEMEEKLKDEALEDFKIQDQ